MLKIPTRKSESVNQRTGDTITKRKRAQEQTMIYKTTLKKLKIGQHELH